VATLATGKQRGNIENPAHPLRSSREIACDRLVTARVRDYAAVAAVGATAGSVRGFRSEDSVRGFGAAL
jgi:hypothetical protein